jgi:hypothetical protein
LSGRTVGRFALGTIIAHGQRQWRQQRKNQHRDQTKRGRVHIKLQGKKEVTSVNARLTIFIRSLMKFLRGQNHAYVVTALKIKQVILSMPSGDVIFPHISRVSILHKNIFSFNKQHNISYIKNVTLT